MKTPSKIEKKLLHYTGKAIADYKMIQTGDRVMVCLSGGKDSFTLLSLLRNLQLKTRNKFYIQAFTLDQQQPGWDDSRLRAWLNEAQIPYEILSRDTYSIVKEKVPETKTYCSLCSRLRRGIIYRYAKEHDFNKIALGHHRDDLITTIMMSMLYNGKIAGMPPKLLTDDKRHILIRPLVYCQEADIIEYAQEQAYPIIPCTLCGSQENLKRKRIANLIKELAAENPKIPSNLLAALSHVRPSQLMDRDLWDFRGLDDQLAVPEDSDAPNEDDFLTMHPINAEQNQRDPSTSSTVANALADFAQDDIMVEGEQLSDLNFELDDAAEFAEPIAVSTAGGGCGASMDDDPF